MDAGCATTSVAASSAPASSGKFRQRDVTILREQFFEKTAVRCELAMTSWPPLEIWRDITSLTDPAKPANARGGRKLQARCRGTPAQALLNVLLKPSSKRHR